MSTEPERERESRLQTDLTRLLLHELEAPLVSIEMELRSLTASKPCREAAERCLLEVRALRALIANVIPLGRQELERKAFPLAPVFRSLEARFRPIAEEREVELSFEDTSLRATGDPRATEHVLSNLVDNAVKFTPRSRAVRVRAFRDPSGRTGVEVVDEGPGLNEAERLRLFEPFFRSDPEAPGFGLGLAIAKTFAERQGAELVCEPDPAGNPGSRFVLRLDP